jgi:hypothetical protein
MSKGAIPELGENFGQLQNKLAVALVFIFAFGGIIHLIAGKENAHKCRIWKQPPSKNLINY